MINIKTEDFVGYSNSGINEAIQNALQQAGDYVRFEIVETRASQKSGANREYQVILTTFVK